MLSPIQQKLINIGSLTSKLLRKNFGRGPEFCQSEENREEFPERLALIKEVNRISSIVQKTPESTFAYQISSKLIV